MSLVILDFSNHAVGGRNVVAAWWSLQGAGNVYNQKALQGPPKVVLIAHHYLQAQSAPGNRGKWLC